MVLCFGFIGNGMILEIVYDVVQIIFFKGGYGVLRLFVFGVS